MKNTVPETLQLNIADEQVNVLGSYHHYGSIDHSDLSLALPEKILDEKSISNSDDFEKRFGKNVEEHWRQKIVDLKWERGLTRRQTKNLLRVGTIRINYKTNTVAFSHDKLLYWYGLLHILMMTLYSLAGSVVVYASPAPMLNQFLGQLGIATTWAITVWVFHFVFIFPHQLLERTRQINTSNNMQT